MDAIIIGVVVVVLIIGLVYQGPDYAKMSSDILKSLHENVMKGDTQAMLDLAELYTKGTLVKKNPDMALKLLLEAAKLGNEEAELRLAKLFINSNSEINTLSNNHEFLLSLGHVYYIGTVGQQDYAKAFELYKQAAELGNSTAEFCIGVMYMEGQGVSQDYVQAFQWFKKSAEHGNLNAKFNLGGMYLEGKGVTQNNKLAVNYFKEVEAADPQNAQVLFTLGLIYLSGKGGRLDYNLAYSYFKKAASLGHAEAQNRLEGMNALERVIHKS